MKGSIANGLGDVIIEALRQHSQLMSPTPRYHSLMNLLQKIALWAVIALLTLGAALVMAGQLGLLRGSAPQDLGVKDGHLKAPSLTPNSVSSQAALFADHPQKDYAQIAPLAIPGDPSAAMATAAKAVQALEGCSIVKQDAAYLYAQCRTVWLGFVDDLELWHNAAQQRIEVRSASRIGRKDFGVNRARVDALRARLGEMAANGKK